MTESSCWIEPIDDDDFAAFVKDRSGLFVPLADKPHIFGLSPRPGSYWINILTDWTEANGLSLRYLDSVTGRVRVSKAQILSFLQSVYGPDPAGQDRGASDFVARTLKNGCVYWLCADEF